jgi:hypothetical protein
MLATGLVLSNGVNADPVYPGDEKLLYQLYCQGCHSPGGTGHASVPRLKGHIGTFLQSGEGRAYLVRVPGAATSTLDDVQLAAVLNWMIIEFGDDSIPGDFQPYTASEVASLRLSPLNETAHYRNELLADIAASNLVEQQ